MLLSIHGCCCAPPASVRRQPVKQFVHAACHINLWRSASKTNAISGRKSRSATAPNSFRRVLQLRATGNSSPSETPHLQLATAKLPQGTKTEEFKSSLYQWANTLTSSGRNLPFALPLRTNLTPDGFQISLLRIHEGEPVSVGNIHSSVEEVPNTRHTRHQVKASVIGFLTNVQGNVLFLRFTEGEGSQLVRSSPLPQEPKQRLQTILQGLVDVPLIMNSMQGAIRSAVAQARP